MRRIDGKDPAVNLFGAGKNGFKEQFPGVSLATGLNAKWFNAVQESIVRTIEAAGLQLSEADMDQFVNALAILDLATRNAAIAAAAQDATTKAGAARTSAILAASQDAATRVNLALVAAAADARIAAAAIIPAGTRMLFQQSAAPLGWTKVIDYNDKALRVVSGAAGAGGTVAYSAAFVNGSVGNTTLTIDQMPAHGGHIGASGAGPVEDAQTAPNLATNSIGGGAPHTHTLNLDVQYVDVIIASKN